MSGPSARITPRIARALFAARLRRENALDVEREVFEADWRDAASKCDRWLSDANTADLGEEELIAAFEGVGRSRW